MTAEGVPEPGVPEPGVPEPGVPEPGPRGRRRWSFRTIFGVFLVLLLADWTQAPGRQLSTRACLLGIDLYQATLSRLMPSLGVRCRLEPSCSHYGEGALRCAGLPRGAVLAVWRILRCGPWTPLGTQDPPPCDPAASDPPAVAVGTSTR